MSPDCEEKPDKKNLLQCNCFFHAHNPVDANVHLADRSKDILVLILRDFKEALMSNAYDNEVNAINHLKGIIAHSKQIKDPYSQRNNSLINTLRCYDDWPESRRLLIYYEDLMLDPEECIMEIASFFEIKNLDRVEKFLTNYELHHIGLIFWKNISNGTKRFDDLDQNEFSEKNW